MDFQENLLDLLSEHRVIASIALLLGLILLRTLLHRLINRRVRDLRNRYVWRQMVTYFIVFNVFMGLLTIWAEWFRNTVPLLGLVAAALTLVSKELLLNFIAYWVIIWRGVFSVGDRIQIGPNVGDVMEIGFLYVALAEVGNWVGGDEPTGRVIKVPNSSILTQAVPNYTRGRSLIWNELTIELPLSADWKALRAIAQKVLEEHTHPFSEEDLSELRKAGEELMFARRDAAVYSRPHDDKMRLTLRYCCKFHRRRRTEQAIWDDLIRRLEQETDLLAQLQAPRKEDPDSKKNQ